MKKQGGPRVLYYDIENSWIEGGVWGLYEQDVVMVNRDWHLLSVSWQWEGEKQVHVIGLPDFPLYKKDPRNDRELTKHIHGLFDEADIVIAHNGDKFDQKKSQARMIIHGMKPPSPYIQIDTLKVARKYFAFSSNRLDDLGEYLGVGRKLSTGGKYLWKACLEGDMKAWAKMKRYNKQDVVLLREVYFKLRPWIQDHPAMNVLLGELDGCPKCGSVRLHKRGTRKITKTTTAQRYQCQDCGGWSHSRSTSKQKMQYVN